MKGTPVRSWEAHLVYRARAGERVAFELIADAYRPVLYNLALRMLRNPEDAHDAVQESFVKAFRALEEFDADRPLRPWLTRICNNVCVDSVRMRRKGAESLEPHEFMLADPNEGGEEASTRGWRSTQLMQAIARLPKRYQEIVVMRHFRHMDVSEIAAALGKPEGTIKSWLFRARAMLRADLAPALG